MRILIVEDEEKAAASLKRGLQESGYVVDVSTDGDMGRHLALNGSYGLILLDILLPKVDGWTILRDLRRAGLHVPVLLLTALDAVQDRVRGLDLGADDYLVKPFAFSELLARIRSVLRRGGRGDPDVRRVGDLELDAARHRAYRGGKPLDLTPKEFLMLSLFLRRRGDVLSRAVIAEQVWDMDFSCDSNVVDVHVRRLRSKVDDPFDNKLIHTVRGVGYVLEARGQRG